MFKRVHFERACMEMHVPILDGFSLFVEHEGLKIYRKKEDGDGTWEFKIFGELKGVTPDVCSKVINDVNYRKLWDPYVKDAYKTSQDKKSVVYWNVNYPFPLLNRDYVYATQEKIICLNGRQFWVTLAEAAEVPGLPEIKGTVRVTEFYENLVFASSRQKSIGASVAEAEKKEHRETDRPTEEDRPTDDAPRTELFAHISDNPRGQIPTWMSENWAKQKCIPDFYRAFMDACEMYEEYLALQTMEEEEDEEEGKEEGRKEEEKDVEKRLSKCKIFVSSNNNNNDNDNNDAATKNSAIEWALGISGSTPRKTDVGDDADAVDDAAQRQIGAMLGSARCLFPSFGAGSASASSRHYVRAQIPTSQRLLYSTPMISGAAGPPLCSSVHEHAACPQCTGADVERSRHASGGGSDNGGGSGSGGDLPPLPWRRPVTAAASPPRYDDLYKAKRTTTTTTDHRGVVQSTPPQRHRNRRLRNADAGLYLRSAAPGHVTFAEADNVAADSGRETPRTPSTRAPQSPRVQKPLQSLRVESPRLLSPRLQSPEPSRSLTSSPVIPRGVNASSMTASMTASVPATVSASVAAPVSASPETWRRSSLTSLDSASKIPRPTSTSKMNGNQSNQFGSRNNQNVNHNANQTNHNVQYNQLCHNYIDSDRNENYERNNQNDNHNSRSNHNISRSPHNDINHNNNRSHHNRRYNKYGDITDSSHYSIQGRPSFSINSSQSSLGSLNSLLSSPLSSVNSVYAHNAHNGDNAHNAHNAHNADQQLGQNDPRPLNGLHPSHVPQTDQLYNLGSRSSSVNRYESTSVQSSPARRPISASKSHPAHGAVLGPNGGPAGHARPSHSHRHGQCLKMGLAFERGLDGRRSLRGVPGAPGTARGPVPLCCPTPHDRFERCKGWKS